MVDTVRMLTLLDTKHLLLDFVNVLSKLKHAEDELDRSYKSMLGIEKQLGWERKEKIHKKGDILLERMSNSFKYGKTPAEVM